MRLLVVRHAIAEERAPGRAEETRALTPEGRRKMRKAARGLRALEPSIDLLATSPLRRARQTAEIIAAAYGGLKITELDSLKPESPPASLLERLKRASERTLAVVGHEPHLSKTLAFLLAGSQKPFLVLKKGGACLLEFPRAAAEGEARLAWALKASHLRRLS